MSDFTRTSPPSSSPRAIGKWRLLAMWWIAQAVLIALALPAYVGFATSVNASKGDWLGSVSLSDYTQAIGDLGFWQVLGWTAGIITILQLAILLPVRQPRPRLKKGWPLWLAIAATGACGAMLAGGIALAASILITGLTTTPSEASVVMWMLLSVMVASWLVATPLIMAFARNRLNAGQSHDLVLRRVSALLFKGTVIEAALIIPLDIMVRTRTSCYCEMGTFWALTLCIGVGIITLGPIVLLPVFARRNKPWFKNHCDACGYDLSGLPAPKGESASTTPRCPECGAGWRA
ncbi:MAG: hypothetical protein K2W85_06605 [Phycisphaerales bacterium]|nr:hypothetical protein [Phycisphaerales bacterium]